MAKLAGATDEALRRRAQHLAAQLFIDLATNVMARRTGGVGRLASLADQNAVGDVDIEASIEAVIESRAAKRALMPGELIVRQWTQPSIAWCLLVDRSGSMHGEALADAAMAAAAVSVRALSSSASAGSERAIVAFGRECIAIEAMWEHRPDVIERILALRGSGTTNVAAALDVAAQQFAASAAQRRITVLLSDCRSTEPGDVVAAAGRLDELLILAPATDSTAAAHLADQVGARWAEVDGPTSIPAAISRAV